MAGPGGSASLGDWATPEASLSKRGDRTAYCEANPKAGADLNSQSLHWPTPTTENDQGAASERNRHTPSLSSAALWMTPSVSNSAGNAYTRDHGQEGQERPTLTGQTTHWQTPAAADACRTGNYGRGEGNPTFAEQTAQWPTPCANEPTGQLRMKQDRETRDETMAGSYHLQLGRLVEQWQTPASRDFRTPNSQESQESRTIHGGEQLPNFVAHHFLPQVQTILDGQASSMPAVSVHGKELSPTPRPAHVLGRLRLNPAFACWLMGWPWWWTNPALTSSAKSAMASYRCALALHLSSCCGGQA